MERVMKTGVYVLSKARIYELAKELNTTSKRLMEKLAEININVKNHMSLLEDHELEALFNHIGIIKHGDEKKAGVDEKKETAAAPPKPEVRKDAKKDGKSAPRIIRTTEIIIDSRNEQNEAKPVRQDYQRNDSKGALLNSKYDVIRRSDSNSGLRPGFTRGTGMDFRTDQRTVQKQETIRKPVADRAAFDTKHEAKVEAKDEVTGEKRQQNQNGAFLNFYYTPIC